MPRRKSIPTLQELCFETTIDKLESLQHRAELLPRYFIDQLYDRFHLRLKIRRKLDFPFPSNLFFHPKIKKLHSRNFDIEHNELIKKIQRDCNNLRIVICKYIDNVDNITENRMTPELLLSITSNNPLIVHLNLDSCSGLSDEHLILISKHCPQLQYLKLGHNPGVTDKSVNYLPTSLLHLNIKMYTGITTEGCLLALNRLKRLKVLKHHHCWMQVLDLLKLQRHLKPTFSIESLNFDLRRSPNFKIDRTVFEMFPKLRNVQAICISTFSVVTSFVDNNKQNLITNLDIDLPIDAMLFVCRLCPMLEELIVPVYHRSIDFHSEINTAMYDHLVPLQRLRKLNLHLIEGSLSSDDVKLLMQNCKRLQELRISHWRELDVGISVCCDCILETNPLLELENLRLSDCRSTNLLMIKKLLTSLDAFKFMGIYRCESISSADREILERIVTEMNLDVDLTVLPLDE